MLRDNLNRLSVINSPGCNFREVNFCISPAKTKKMPNAFMLTAIPRSHGGAVTPFHMSNQPGIQYKTREIQETNPNQTLIFRSHEASGNMLLFITHSKP